MDFTIRTDLIPRATKPYGEAADGDTLVAVEPFTFGGVSVPIGAAATYRNGNITELPNGDQFAWDDLSEFPVMVVPNSLDYPPGHDGNIMRLHDQAASTEPDMTPDVLTRAEVEQVIRDYAAMMGYPRYGEELIARLPRPETGHEVKVTVYVQATSQHDAEEKVAAALPRDLDAVILS